MVRIIRLRFVVVLAAQRCLAHQTLVTWSPQNALQRAARASPRRPAPSAATLTKADISGPPGLLVKPGIGAPPSAGAHVEKGPPKSTMYPHRSASHSLRDGVLDQPLRRRQRRSAVGQRFRMNGIGRSGKRRRCVIGGRVIGAHPCIAETGGQHPARTTAWRTHLAPDPAPQLSSILILSLSAS